MTDAERSETSFCVLNFSSVHQFISTGGNRAETATPPSTHDRPVSADRLSADRLSADRPSADRRKIPYMGRVTRRNPAGETRPDFLW